MHEANGCDEKDDGVSGNVLKEVGLLTSYYIRKQKMKKPSEKCLPGL